ncbi:MAG TPA: hypothetical protein VHM92_06055 [Allosphingosinicella sp.]|nr:hypothetical protein [Allosphingosinicella sp.]
MMPEAAAGPRRAAVRAAIAAGLHFLQSVQLPSGEIPVSRTTDPAMRSGLVADPSVFPTALAAHCLAFAGDGAHPVLARAHAFLLGEMSGRGLWRHWTRAHPYHASLPPDLDDTSCASAALTRAGIAIADNRRLLLANRRRDGLFLTWFVPRARWTGLEHAGTVLPQLLHPTALLLFFRKTSARPGDVDAVVNANALHYLGVRGLGEVAGWLTDLLLKGREAQCDKWYDNPIVVRYFLSRALAGVAPEAGETIVRRSEAAAPANALEAALLATTLADWGRPAPEPLIARILAGQLPSGGWPPAALYHGGRQRLPEGGFAPPHPDTPRWGSEGLTTAFCIEALARSGAT